MNARRRGRLLWLATVLILVLGVVPNALLIGHWPIFPGVKDAQSIEEAHIRAGHCHLGPSKCTQAPGTVNVIPFSEAAAALLFLGVGLLRLLEDRSRPWPAPYTSPLRRPPRASLLSVPA